MHCIRKVIHSGYWGYKMLNEMVSGLPIQNLVLCKVIGKRIK